MNRTEYFAYLKSKYDEVKPMKDWQKQDEVFAGIPRYKVFVWSKELGNHSFIVFVKNFGQEDEEVIEERKDTEDKKSFIQACAKVGRARSLVELGILEESNQIFKDILDDAKSKLDIDLI